MCWARLIAKPEGETSVVALEVPVLVIRQS
jgi:hypothetical protein